MRRSRRPWTSRRSSSPRRDERLVVRRVRAGAARMTTTLPLFPVTTVGSWPRPPALLASLRALRAGESTRARHDRVVEDAVREVVAAQQRAGVDLVTDGEQGRDN